MYCSMRKWKEGRPIFILIFKRRYDIVNMNALLAPLGASLQPTTPRWRGASMLYGIQCYMHNMVQVHCRCVCKMCLYGIQCYAHNMVQVHCCCVCKTCPYSIQCYMHHMVQVHCRCVCKMCLYRIQCYTHHMVQVHCCCVYKMCLCTCLWSHW